MPTTYTSNYPVKIIVEKGQINLEYSEDPIVFEIKYNGGFIGEVFGEALVRMNSNMMIIIFFELPPTDTMMIYEGAISINRVRAFKSDRTPLNTQIIYKDDKIGRIGSKWDESTMKYEDYNSKLTYGYVSDPIVTYNLSGKKEYITTKGRIPKKKVNINKIKKLERIRSKYGVIK